MSTLVVKCPKCSAPVPWTEEHPFKPFCSERCKFVDFGEWIFEEKRIPGESISEEDNGFDEGFFQ